MRHGEKPSLVWGRVEGDILYVATVAKERE